MEGDDHGTGDSIADAQVVADDLGNALAVWVQDDGLQRSLRARRFDGDASAWGFESSIESFDEGDAAAPKIVVDRDSGDALVVWEQGRPDPIFGAFFPIVDVYAARYRAP